MNLLKKYTKQQALVKEKDDYVYLTFQVCYDIFVNVLLCSLRIALENSNQIKLFKDQIMIYIL